MPLLSGFPFPFVQAPLPLTFAETNAIGTPVEVLSIRVSKPEARACIGVRLESDHHSFPRVARIMNSEMTELHTGDIIRKVNGRLSLNRPHIRSVNHENQSRFAARPF